MATNKDSSHNRRKGRSNRSNEPRGRRICSKWVVVALVLAVFGFGAFGIYMYKADKLPKWMISRTKENGNQEDDQSQQDDDKKMQGDPQEQDDDQTLPVQDDDQSPLEQDDDQDQRNGPSRDPSIMPSVEPTSTITTGETFSSPKPTLQLSSVPSLRPSSMPSIKPTPTPSSSPSLSLLPTPEITSCLSKSDYPNIDHLTFSVNAVSGKPPSEQNIDRVGSQIFQLTDCLRFGLKRIDKVDHCDTKVQESEDFWTTSTSSLASQVPNSDLDLGIDTNLIETIFPEQASGMGPTTIRNALLFGNSVSSNEASDRKSDYFTKSFTSLVTRTLYSVELDYDDIAASGAWTEDFIIACSALGQHSGQKRLLEFISKYGTHGLATASLGKRCRSTLYMEGVGRREDYQQLRNKVETNDKGRWELKSDALQGGSEIPQNATNTSFEFLVSQSKENCEGRLSSNSCAGSQDTDELDEPIVINWTFKPIWEMNVPGFTQSAKDALKKTVESTLAAAVKCSKSNCNNLGACTTDVDKWNDVDKVKYWIDLFDPDRCFCFGTMEGDKCVDAALLTTPWPLEYVSTLQGDFKYSAFYNDRRGGISGVYSLFSDIIIGDKQRFKVSVPALITSDFIEEETTEITEEEKTFQMICPDGKVLSYLEAKNYGRAGMRAWRVAKCGRFDGWKTADCDWSGDVNPAYTVKKFDFKCPSDRGVMGGMIVDHEGNTRENGLYTEYPVFAFKCCRLIVDNDA